MADQAAALTNEYAPYALDSEPREWSVRWARTADELAAIYELRRRVFRDEQRIIDARVTDRDDERSLHAIAVAPEGVIGAGRLTPPARGREAHIAWVATLPAYRNRGVGTAVMRALLEAADAAEFPVVVLSAQTHALAFYERLGFVAYGNRYHIRGIEHQMMARRRPERQPLTVRPLR
ncbi:MAG TPA: GNAT family N-acetyltransferase [Thermomicrobiales bacterium]